ncbi:MAG: hypothetical protein ACFFCP_06025, partial [Promethearchaeota archaeon]
NFTTQRENLARSTISFLSFAGGTGCGRFIVNEESGVEELRGEIADLRREVYQQRTCLIFV